jgi:DNA-binding IclR family transcriptional regulator
MARRPSSADIEAVDTEEGDPGRTPSGSQTLQRGLDVLDAVSAGPIGLSELAEGLGLTRSTTHRLAAALVERRFLTLAPREGYSLGPKLLELGFLAQQQRDLYRVARPHLEALAALTEDTVHLGVLDEERALYLDKLPGKRRIEISSRIGDRQPLTSTGLGKALLLDDGEPRWRALFAREGDGAGPGGVSLELWLERIRDYAARGCAFDLEENEDRIRCVAAPIRGVAGKIVGAISVSGAAQYMDDSRMAAMAGDVVDTARSISRDLGWTETARPALARPRARKANISA